MFFWLLKFVDEVSNCTVTMYSARMQISVDGSCGFLVKMD